MYSHCNRSQETFVNLLIYFLVFNIIYAIVTILKVPDKVVFVATLCLTYFIISEIVDNDYIFIC